MSITSHVRITRRAFTTAGTAGAALTALQAGRVLGANERVRLGVIGVGNRGGQVMDAFLKHPDVELAAMCDVCRSTLEASNAKWADGKAALYGDFRKLIDHKGLDAVVVATPDHWHAIQMIAACNAGKDVYCEKPLSMTIHEGRRMVEAARRNQRVVQVGTHRRSGKAYAQAAKLIAANTLGKVTIGRAFDARNMFPHGIGKAAPSTPPTDLDWNMWLGPRPLRPFQSTITPYKFRWWQAYSSQMANQGVHFLDIIRWLTGDELAPVSVCAMGGRFAIDDDRTVPDVMEAMFTFASGRLVVFGVYETSGNRGLPRGAFAELRGTQGALYASDAGFEVIPERGSAELGPGDGLRMEPIKVQLEDDGYRFHMLRHTRNFLDCVKSREKPCADVEIGHRSTTMSHLANIALATESVIKWDAERETITNNAQANNLLHYEYRKPWTLE
jgi:predicted dehydrogenase